MFVISKHFEGREFARLETLDPSAAVEAMRDWLVQACEDPRFSFHVGVGQRPGVPVAGTPPALQKAVPCIPESLS